MLLLWCDRVFRWVEIDAVGFNILFDREIQSTHPLEYLLVFRDAWIGLLYRKGKTKTILCPIGSRCFDPRI